MNRDDAIRLAIAQNVATNGRLFCAALILINITAGQFALAVLACAPIGLACLADLRPVGRLGSVLAVATYLFAAFVAFLTYVNVW